MFKSVESSIAVYYFSMFLISLREAALSRGIVVDVIAVCAGIEGIACSSPVVVHKRVAVLIQEIPKSRELKQDVIGRLDILGSAGLKFTHKSTGPKVQWVLHNHPVDNFIAFRIGQTAIVCVKSREVAVTQRTHFKT